MNEINKCNKCHNVHPPVRLPHIPYYANQWDHRANYTTNSLAYYDYLGRFTRYLMYVEDIMNRLLRRDLVVQDTKSIDLTKVGEWIDNGMCPPCNFDDVVTLSADIILSKYVEKITIPSLGKEYDVKNGTIVRDDGVWSPDYGTVILDIGEGKENKLTEGRLINVSRETATTKVSTRAEMPIRTDTSNILQITKDEAKEETVININESEIVGRKTVVDAGAGVRVLFSEIDNNGQKEDHYKVAKSFYAANAIVAYEPVLTDLETGNPIITDNSLYVGINGSFVNIVTDEIYTQRTMIYGIDANHNVIEYANTYNPENIPWFWLKEYTQEYYGWSINLRDHPLPEGLVKIEWRIDLLLADGKLHPAFSHEWWVRDLATHEPINKQPLNVIDGIYAVR